MSKAATCCGGTTYFVRMSLSVAIVVSCVLNIYNAPILSPMDYAQFRLPHHRQPLRWDSNTNRSIIVDVLSIGSTDRQHIKRQIDTFGSHRVVRNFFMADERTDPYPSCSDQLSMEDALNISRFCHSKKWHKETQWIMNILSKHFITRERLENNPNPMGWLCAQARPLHALFQVQHYYERHSLPDYLLIVDDDTYFNMKKFEKHFPLEGASKIKAIAGCRIKFHLYFSAPLGGFGIIFTRKLLHILMTPIDCNDSLAYKANITNHLCQRLASNRIGEYPVFQRRASQGPGTLVEMMKDYAEESPFKEHDRWTTGYCLHSDWATGYFISLLSPENARSSTGIPPLISYNTHPKMRSVFNLRFKYKKWPLNICRYEEENCTATSEACHYMKPDMMTKIFDEQESLSPTDYGLRPIVVELRGGENSKRKS